MIIFRMLSKSACWRFGMFLVTATSFFEFADPQLDSGGDFSRTLKAGLFQAVDFPLSRPLISMFDNSDLVIHDLSSA
jgi:hypothetical protein